MALASRNLLGARTPANAVAPAEASSTRSGRRSRTGKAWQRPKHLALHRRRKAYCPQECLEFHRHAPVETRRVSQTAKTRVPVLPPKRWCVVLWPMFAKATSTRRLQLAEFRHPQQGSNIALSQVGEKGSRGCAFTLPVFHSLNEACSYGGGLAVVIISVGM